MGKHSIKKRKKRDFVTHRKKLGKKVKPASHTDLSFKSQSVYLQSQNFRTDESVEGLHVTSRNLTLKDLLGQVKHYNPQQQKEACLGLRELVTTFPVILETKLSSILEATIPLLLDLDYDLRTALRQLYEGSFPLIQQNHMKPFLGYFLAVISNGMTHHQLKMRLYSLKILNLILDHFPDIVYHHYSKILPHLTKTTHIDDVKDGKRFINTQVESIKALNKLLTIIFHGGRLKIPIGPHIHCHFKQLDSNQSKWGEKCFYNFQPYEDQSLKIVDNILNSGKEKDGISMENQEDLVSYMKSTLTHLMSLWIEYTKTENDLEILREVLDILYKNFYILEEILLESHIQTQDVYFDLLGDNFKYFNRKIPMVGTKATNHYLLFFISFFFGSQDQLLSWEERFLHSLDDSLTHDLSLEEIGRFCGVIHRISNKISPTIYNSLFDRLVTLLTRSDIEKQSLILESIIKLLKIAFPSPKTIKTLISILTTNIFEHTERNMMNNSKMIQILTTASKLPKMLDLKSIQSSMTKFLWNMETKSVGNFSKLTQSDQKQLISIMFYFDELLVDFIKALSQTLSDDQITLEVVTLGIEILRLKKVVNVNLFCSLLLSMICSKPYDEILNEVLVSLAMVQGFAVVAPFLENIMKKENLSFELVYCLFKIVERANHLNIELKIDIKVFSNALISFFVKSQLARIGIDVCEGVLKNQKIFMPFLEILVKSEYFLELLAEICKFTKVVFTPEFFKITKVYKQKKDFDGKKVEEIDTLMSIIQIK